MPSAPKTLHATIYNPALGYVTNSSPISVDPQYIGGHDTLTSLRGYLERRPGFADSVEVVASSFTNLKRIFVWQRWANVGLSGSNAGSFFIMFNDIVGTTSRVYKYEVGTDTSAVLIHTDSASVSPFFFVEAENQCYFGNGTTAANMRRYEGSGTTTWKWGIDSPVVAPTIGLSGTGINGLAGYYYTQTYGRGTGTGSTAVVVHESSPSPISVCTGIFTNMEVDVTLVASTDSQVNQIHVYRTTDGGANTPDEMLEITGSPFANINQVVVDTTLDADLGNSGPPFLRNDPPPPSLGFIWYAGRVWSFLGNTVYYSGFEEIAQGVPEECWPGGLDGNFYPYDREVQALAPMDSGIAIFTPKRIYGIDGDSLDTFRRFTLLDKRGTRAIASVVAVGNSIAWFDTSSQVWVSDLGEIGAAIRPDLANIDPQFCYMAMHISNNNHWVLVLDGAKGTIFTFDLDKNQWMTPWKVGTTVTCMTSAETSEGVVNLMIGRNGTKAVQLNISKYNDDGDLYGADVRTNQYHIAPDSNPAWRGVIDWTEWKRDGLGSALSDAKQITDEDPDYTSKYVSLFPNKEAGPLITQGIRLVTERCTSNTPVSSTAGLELTWPAEDKNFRLYQLDLSMHQILTNG